MIRQPDTAVLLRTRCFASRFLFGWITLGGWMAARATIITWTNASGGSWAVANNWSPNQIPSAADTVLITNNGAYAVTLNANAQVSSLIVGASSGSQTLNVGSSLTLTNGGTINSSGILNLNGSTLAGVLNVTGVLNCNGGSLGNAGTVNWTGTANLQLYQNGGIVNQAGGLFNVQNDQSLSGSGSPYFNNFGTFQKSAGTNTTTISVPFNNTGGLNVASGTVALTAGGVDTGTITGVGNVSVPSGTFTVNGAIPTVALSGGTLNGVGATIGNLTWSGGTLQGTNTLTDLASWTGGNLGSASAVTVASNAVLTIGGNFTTLYLYGALTNAGTVNWTGTANLQVYNSSLQNQTGGIVNEPGALFNVQNDQSLGGSGSPYFNNFGTFQKSAGTNTTTLNVPFNNTGGLNVASGTVAFAGGGMNSGTITGAGNVSVPGGTFTLNGAIPTLVLSGGTLNGVGATIGNLTWSGGTLQGTNTLTGLASWTGGSLGSASAVTVASNAVLTIGANFTTLYLYGALTNAGTVNWTGTANLQLYNSSAQSQTGGIVNEPGALFNVQNDQSLGGSGSPYFNNFGTFQKSTGTNTTTLNVSFNNTGGLNVASGTVAFAGGGVDSGTISGVGSVSVPGGTFTVYSAVPKLVLSGGTFNGVGATIGNLNWSSGTLQGTNTVTGLWNWTGGILGNASAVTVASNAVLTINGSSALYLYGVLTNTGTVNWTGTSDLQLYNSSSQGQTGGIVNEPGAVFDVQNDRSLGGSGSPYFNNFGTFRKSTGTNTTAINVPFNNAGTLSLNIYGPSSFGKISFSGSVALAGVLNVNFMNGYFPGVGDSFTLLTYGSETGAFSALSLLPLSPAWETNILTYGSTSFTLTIGSIYKLAFASAPAGTNAAGAVFAPVLVQVQDLNGAPFPTNGVPVNLALSAGSGTLSGTVTQNTGPTGQATFNDLSVNLAGTKSLTASSPPWITPVSSQVVIVSGPAAQLHLTASPASLQKQGYAFSPAPTVQVLDAFGNIVSNSTALITASSSSSGAGTLTGTLGVTASGSATFGNLHYTLGDPAQAESVVLYFNSAGLVSATNSPIMVDFVPSTLTLTDGNSVVQIDPNSQNGVFAWFVDGTSQLFQQWFWLRLTNGPQVSFDQLATPLGTSSTATNATITYLPQGLAVTLSFTLQGGGLGSHSSSLAETISLRNTNTSPVTLHLYAYTDFELGGIETGDTIAFPTNTLAVQQGKGMTATQSIQGRAPDFWEASWYPLVLDTINSTTPAVLSDTIIPNQPGDQTFAYQWDLTLGAGQTLLLSLANSISSKLVFLSIALSGSNVLLFWPTNGADNLKLQSNASLDPASAWTNVTTTPATVGANYQVTVPPNAVDQFFRLH